MVTKAGSTCCHDDEPSGRNFDAATLFLALLVLFSRPTGVLFVLPVLVWWLSSQIPGSAITVRAGGVLALLIAMAFTPVLNREQLDVVVGSPVICGFPEHPEAVDLFQGNTLAAAQGHVIAEHGLMYWAGLVTRRSVSLLVPYRSYFSPVHNGLGLLLVLLYPLALIGLWRTWKEPMVQVITVVLVLNILLVALQQKAPRLFTAPPPGAPAPQRTDLGTTPPAQTPKVLTAEEVTKDMGTFRANRDTFMAQTAG
jgi:hypothetical protein